MGVSQCCCDVDADDSFFEPLQSDVFPQLTPYFQNYIATKGPFPEAMHYLHANPNALVYKYQSDIVYEGEVNNVQGYFKQNKLPHGFGKLLKGNILVLGYFQHGKINGQVHYIVDEKSFFQGQMQANEMTCAKGLFHSEEVSYEGGFNRGKFHGSGKEATKAYTFLGRFLDGRRLEGTLMWGTQQENTIFTGRFDQKEQFTGLGKLVEPSGTYEGQFFKGFKHGSGLYKYTSGMRYQGSYNSGLRSGKGKLYNNDGTLLYSGDFIQGLPHGKGKLRDNPVQETWVNGLQEKYFKKLQSMDQINSQKLQIHQQIDEDSQSSQSVNQQVQIPVNQQYIQQLEEDKKEQLNT